MLRPSAKFEVRRPSRSEDAAHLVCQLSIYNSFPVIRTTIEKIVVLTYHRLHCFVCPGDAPVAITQYVAWMERQFNARQTPRSVYLSIFNSFRVIRCLNQCVSPKIAIFTTFMFPLHGDAPEAITLNVWMEREFDAYKLSRCMCPSNYNRFLDRARYLWNIVILSYPLAFDAPVREVPVGISAPPLVWKN